MSGYQKNWSWEDAAAEGMGQLAALAIAAAITLLIILVMELARIYGARALQPTPTARVLWVALTVVIGIAVVCGFLVANPPTAPLGAYIAAWSFLMFLIVVEGCDLYEKRFDPAEDTGEVNIEETFARPWVTS